MTRKLTARRFSERSSPTLDSLTPAAFRRRFISGSTMVMERAVRKWPNVIHRTRRTMSSGPDCYHSVLSKWPGGTGVNFPVLNMHSHAWPLYSAVKLLGTEFVRTAFISAGSPPR